MEPYQELEFRFGEWIGNPNTVACSSGTAALHLALEALQLPIHSCVMVPEFTMVACARAVTMAGLHPIFIDCGDDLLLDTKVMQSKTVRHQSAIMPVHIYGRRCSMKAIIDHAKTNNLAVVEDMAEIHGVNPHPESDAACWSFYKNKIVHGEEGGMVAFKEAKHADKARQLRSLGFTQAHDFAHIPR
ncbi:DegT/DnrJ/EryC1/StrS family aminotransferase, partial [Candidatus Pacearchaeota archaeon]|nr:DegT/DnrJ/EryC1/StrS family aminotransferase [Candidatus Pacearchaeota archaeon]